MENGFRILEHPSDLGIEATGADLKEAFRQAALALMSIVVDPTTVQPSVRKEVTLEGSDAENLLVQWLSEILYLYDGQGFLVCDVELAELTRTMLRATLYGENAVEGKHTWRMDVKAITYHQLCVSQRPEGASVRVFLDI